MSEHQVADQTITDVPVVDPITGMVVGNGTITVKGGDVHFEGEITDAHYRPIIFADPGARYSLGINPIEETP